MSDTPNTPPVDTGVPPVDTPPADAPPSGLPSDQVPADAFDGFSLSDSQKELFKDGKLNGRFGSLDDVLVKLKEAEDFRAKHGNDAANAQAALEADKKAGKTAEATQIAQNQAINELIPTFIQNGMVLTPEMETKATEAGIDIRDLKLGALELRDATNIAHSVVGGKENYDAMLAWGQSNMDDAQKAAFDRDVTSGMSKYAIKGLYGEYQEALEAGTAAPRVEGQPAFVGIKPYGDRKELYRDKDYIESPAGKRDSAAINNYRARLKATPNSILGIG